MDKTVRVARLLQRPDGGGRAGNLERLDSSAPEDVAATWTQRRRQMRC